MGRLLITLFLMENKVLTKPALYISYFLKRNRVEYYDRMTEVRSKGNYEQWIRFFLTAISESAQDAIQTVDLLTALHEKNEARIGELGRARINTISAAVKRLQDLEILVQTENVNRNRTFAYEAYLDILRKGT